MTGIVEQIGTSKTKQKEFEKGTFDKHATKDGCKWQQIVIHL